MLKYREQMDNRFQWTIIGVPSVKWSEKVFPKLKGEAAVEAMWEAIIKATRVTNDPLAEWDRHNATLQQRSKQLDALNLDYLHFQSSNGTDFKIWMIPEGGLKETITNCDADLKGHSKKVMLLKWHPTAEFTLGSTSMDGAG